LPAACINSAEEVGWPWWRFRDAPEKPVAKKRTT